MYINIGGLFMLVLVGGLAGWIAGLVTQKRGFGIVGNIIIGIIGAAIGGTIMWILGIPKAGFLGALFFAIIGAVLLLIGINAVFKKK